jgi:hypothetical protein
MTAIIMDLALKFWPYIAAIGAALALIWQQRRAGAKAERAKQAEREAKARDIADQVDNDVGALPPADARKELGKWSR